MVPMGWLIAILGAACSAFVLSFTVGVWVTTVSIDSKAALAKVEKLESEDTSGRLVRVETILTMVYPEQAREARRRLATEKENP